MRSPSTTSRSRSTPCVAGCCGPMLSTMSAVPRRDVSAAPPTPTLSSRAPDWSLTRRSSHHAWKDRSVEPFDPADVTWQRVSPRLAAARRLALSVQMLVLVAIPIVLVVLGVPAWVLVVVPVLLGVFAWAWWVVGRQVGAIGYAEREDDLLVRRGIL